MLNRRLSMSQKSVKNSDKQKNRRNYHNVWSFLVNEANVKDPGPSVSLSEAALKIPKSQLIRSSSFNAINMCEHCEHEHAKKCCLYVYDDLTDIPRYASFKKELDQPYWVMSKSEDYDLTVGNFTPKHFPCFTENDPDVADHKMLLNYREPPVIYFRQYVWPIFFPPLYNPPVENIDNFRNPNDVKFMSPPVYGDFLQAMQQHPYMPCIMNQVAIRMGGDITHSQVIESHSFLPIHYTGRF